MPSDPALPAGALDELAATARAAPALLGATALVVVDGPSGSGKSVLAERLACRCAATLISTDDFATWDEPFGWWPRLRAGVLEPLARGETGCYRRTDWSAGEPRPGALRVVEPPRLLVLEGVSAARREVAGTAGLSVWCSHADAAARLERSVARDGEAQRANLARWQRMERGWFAVDRPEQRADFHVRTA